MNRMIKNYQTPTRNASESVGLVGTIQRTGVFYRPKPYCMYRHLFLSVFLVFFTGKHPFAQEGSSAPAIDPLSFGVVLDHPAMKAVKLKSDVAYLKDAKGSLNIDIYSPPNLATNDKRPAIIFLNAIGERPGGRKVKSWGIYTSWPKLMAAYGYIGISMESDGARIQESIQGLFNFLAEKGAGYNIDRDKLGVYAASANVTQSVVYLMGEKAYPGIKAAVLYYGNSPAGPFRKDLPVFFVVSEGDASPNRYNALWNEVLKNNAPWTIKMGSGMPHAFDAYSDNDDARKIIKETISFWQNHLDPVLSPSWSYSKSREVLGTIQMDPPKAINLLKSLADENPRDASTLSFYGSALRHANRMDEAESVYKKVLGLEPNNIEALISLTVVAYSRNKTTEAEAYILTALNSGKMTRDEFAQLGFTLLVADKNKEAAVYYEKALALEPRAIDYYNLGCAYAKINVKDKAFQALEQAVKYGYDSKQQFESDGDLNSLRSDDRYKSLLERLK